ncbi:phosphoglycolate phosphatase [Legionella massiliensis]|uniref:Phosphoglycolate phosphatase n=1 Tax=Legionella massiliensis TaxID=1034943 RepID=A0A078KYM4_9GAMM|nr:HAD-IA family hydrolase [Legionella massiliensis]CDZ76874.1 phosphoglycolate phosphatase [Legionella massiliensis]CEE12612.1 Phosphoglycolate phosphatase [Legionella massiliensis]
MGRAYRLVVFDWEGTVGDTLGQILNTVATEARRLQFGELDEQLARQSVELGLVLAVKKTFPHLNEQQQEQLLLAVHHSLVSRTSEVYLIPGVKEFAQRLHDAGIDLAIASNKGQQSLQRVLHVSELDKLFKVTRSAGQTLPKPNPQMLEEIIAVFGVSAEETLMVGDSISDIEMAKSINVDAIGVDFYHQQKEALRAAGALEVFDDYQLLAEYLQLS